MQTNDPIADPEQVNTPPVTEAPVNQKSTAGKSIAIWFSVGLVVILLGTTGIFAYKYYELKHQVDHQPDLLPLSTQVATVAPSPTLAPQPTTNPITAWKSYSNSTHQISFKYPSEWSFTEKLGQIVEGTTYNTEVILSKGLARIIMHFNMDGIGGKPMELEGTPFILDGNQLYQYHYDRPNTNSKIVGISSSLTSLGVFELGGVTYSLILDYPMTYNEVEEQEVLEVFNQLLSTFKFTN